MWLYTGPSNPTRRSTGELDKSEVKAQIRRVLEESNVVDLGDHPTSLRTSAECTFAPLQGLGNIVCPPRVQEDRTARAT
jgi:hypothetical protein